MAGRGCSRSPRCATGALCQRLGADRQRSGHCRAHRRQRRACLWREHRAGCAVQYFTARRTTEPAFAQYPAEPRVRCRCSAVRRANPVDHLRSDHQLQPGQIRAAPASRRGAAEPAQPQYHTVCSVPRFGGLSDPHGAYRDCLAGRGQRQLSRPYHACAASAGCRGLEPGHTRCERRIVPGQRHAMHDRPELPGDCRCATPDAVGGCYRRHEF